MRHKTQLTMEVVSPSLIEFCVSKILNQTQLKRHKTQLKKESLCPTVQLSAPWYCGQIPLRLRRIGMTARRKDTKAARRKRRLEITLAGRRAANGFSRQTRHSRRESAGGLSNIIPVFLIPKVFSHFWAGW
jgi:hypothetical protein